MTRLKARGNPEESNRREASLGLCFRKKIQATAWKVDWENWGEQVSDDGSESGLMREKERRGAEGNPSARAV